MPSATFRFGSNAEHEATVECGYFGSERYFVNDALVLSHWSLQPSGMREFTAQGHTIQVRLAVNMKGARAEALVDGKLVAEDLFAEFNASLARRRGLPWLVKVAVWLAVGLAVFASLKSFERSTPSVDRTSKGWHRHVSATAHVKP